MNYNSFCEILQKEKLEFQFEYNNIECWIIVNDCYRFLCEEKGIIKLFQTSFELLDACLIDNKTLNEIWDEIHIESFEYGWSKTINVNQPIWRRRSAIRKRGSD